MQACTSGPVCRWCAAAACRERACRSRSTAAGRRREAWCAGVSSADYAAHMIVVPAIRLATLRDARAIAELSRDEIEHGLGWSWTPERVRRSIRDRSTNDEVAYEADKLVGFGIMSYGDEKAHLSLLAVHPSRREQA